MCSFVIGRGGGLDDASKSEQSRSSNDYWRKYDKEDETDWRSSNLRSDKLGLCNIHISTTRYNFKKGHKKQNKKYPSLILLCRHTFLSMNAK